MHRVQLLDRELQVVQLFSALKLDRYIGPPGISLLVTVEVAVVEGGGGGGKGVTD